jgi:hypothetical protein
MSEVDAADTVSNRPPWTQQPKRPFNRNFASELKCRSEEKRNTNETASWFHNIFWQREKMAVYVFAIAAYYPVVRSIKRIMRMAGVDPR